jgi:hypothetical protein
MRPWIIVLSSSIGAIAAAVLLAGLAVMNAAPSEIVNILVAHVLHLAVAALAVYALCAMLMVTATLLTGTLRVRHEMEANSPEASFGRRDWVAALGANGLQRLASRLVPALAESESTDGSALRTRFRSSEMRNEIVRLHYISLARSHFFSALIVLTGIVGLGLARDHGSVPFLWAAIPTISAILVLFGLALLTVLGRIAIDVTAEPLLEAISQLQAEGVEFGPLRRAVELLERASNAVASRDRAPAPSAQIPERLVASIEQGHHTLLDAVGRLSTNTQALGAAMQSSVETIETALRTAAAQQQPSDSDKTAADTNALPELQAAIEELTAVLQRLSAVPEGGEQATLAADPVPARRRVPPPRLAGELRKLLQEIDAGC